MLKSFLVSHTEHVHDELFCFATIDLNRSSTCALELGIDDGAGVEPLFGLLPPQHRHFVWATSLSAMHESHAHFDCFCFATIDLKTSSTVADAPLLDEIGALTPSDDDAELLATPQHTHLVAEFSFGVKHDEHDHLFCFCLAASAFMVSSHCAESVDGTCLANENSGFFVSADFAAGDFVIGVVVVGAFDDNGFAALADDGAFTTIGSLNL